MRKLIIFLYCLPLLVVFACSPITVGHIEAAPGFRLSNYSTFNFVEADSQENILSEKYSPHLDYIKSALIDQLEERGLRYSATDPDLLINLGIVVVEEVQTRETDFMTDRPRYMGQRRYHWQSEEVVVGRYKEGTISIHLADREQNELVWEGGAEAVVPDKSKQLKRRIQKGVQELVEKMPQ